MSSLSFPLLDAAAIKHIRSVVLPRAEWHGRNILFKSVMPPKLRDYEYYGKKFFARIHKEPDSYGYAIVSFMDVTWSLMGEVYGTMRIADAFRYNENPYTAMMALLNACFREKQIRFGQPDVLSSIANACMSYRILRDIPKVMSEGIREYNEGLEKLNLSEAAEKRQKLAIKIYRRLQILIE